MQSWTATRQTTKKTEKVTIHNKPLLGEFLTDSWRTDCQNRRSITHRYIHAHAQYVIQWSVNVLFSGSCTPIILRYM